MNVNTTDMIKRFTYILAIPALMLLGSCATTKSTAQLDQSDDVYNSVARAKEEPEVIARAVPEKKQESDYVTDEQLYGDAGDSYYGDYAGRIYRFRDYAPWRNYYSSIYSFYDPYYYYGNPFYSNGFYDSYYGYGGLGLSFSIGSGFFYNPWRTYGYGYGNGFWGPYSYYNYGYYPPYYGGYYGGGYGIINPGYTSPNYRPRPVRSSGSLPIDRGAIRGGAASGVGRNANGNTIQRRAAERPATQSATGRPQQAAPRPERVQQAPPPRVNTAPSNNNSGGGRSSGGSSSGSSARPSRAN